MLENGMDSLLLSAIVFAPLLTALVVMLACYIADSHKPALSIGFGGTLFTFFASLQLFFGFEPTSPHMQFVQRAFWFPELGISYALGVDGISVLLVMLTTFLMPLIIIGSESIKRSPMGYVICMLVLETAMLGTLMSLDTFLFYCFWELMLFPMYFIIGIWGGARRVYATLKFVLYTVFGSVLMFLALLYVAYQVYLQSGHWSFDISILTRVGLTYPEELVLFAAFALAFAIKVPIFPFHTWLPDAHVEAPTGGSVILAGVLLKMGLYGLIRFAYPMFPNAAQAFTPLLATLAVIGIVYGALVAWAQTDMKKLVAYSSVSHLGFCVLGFVALTTMSATGSIFQMLAHGITSGALFFVVGVLYERRHTREIAEYGGLSANLPLFALCFFIFTMASIALPLTNGFVGEFLILLGSYKTLPVYTMVAMLGVVLSAVYMLSLFLRVMFGKLDEAKNGSLKDLCPREIAILAPLAILVIYMGVAPGRMLGMIEPTVATYISDLEERRSGVYGLDRGDLALGAGAGTRSVIKTKTRADMKAGAV